MIHQKLCAIFDSTLPINLDSYIHFLYWSLDIGGSCTFAHDPQGEHILLHEIEIFLPKVVHYIIAIFSP